jgi:molecular chaperone DnaK
MYSVEKLLKDNSDKIESGEKMTAEEKVSNAKKALESGSIEEIKSAAEELEKISHSITEAMYKKTAEQQSEASSQNAEEEQTKKPTDENVVDAEFEEVKDKNNS